MGMAETIMGMAGPEIEKLVGSGGGPALIGEISGLVGQGGANLPAMLQKFQASGLGGAAQSWVGSGPNQAITGQQAQSVLGSDTVTNLATKLGVPPAIAASAVALVLPHIVNHLTPGGTLPGIAAGAQAAGTGGLFKKVTGLFGRTS